MTLEENIRAILECNFTGYKDEIIDIATKRIMSLSDIENQKTGQWIKDGDSYSDLYDYKIRCHCSIGGNEKFFIDRKTTSGTPCIKNCDNVDKYCSNCGAKMQGESNAE